MLFDYGEGGVLLYIVRGVYMVKWQGGGINGCPMGGRGYVFVMDVEGVGLIEYVGGVALH